ncbi:outer membrane lipoprotein-sorting protein [Syntrophotalea carbinolica]|nr:outer membrane lipoprotein-sorting protein [Syntrophotalea carbinolica]
MLLVFLIIMLVPPCNAPAAPELDLRTLIREVEDQYTGISSQALMRMQVRTEHWQRSLKMEAWSLGRDRFLIRILEPAKERDVATLKSGREVWNYLPKVDRVIKIPPSMMGGAWMGSHITNNDLVKQSHIDQDYDFTLLSETDRFWRIEGQPKPDAAVVWGKIIYQVGKMDRVPQRIAYFDEDMALVREILFDQVQTIGSRRLPMRMVVQPVDKPQEQTILEYYRIEFDLPLREDFFSLRNLKRR